MKKCDAIITITLNMLQCIAAYKFYLYQILVDFAVFILRFGLVGAARRWCVSARYCCYGAVFGHRTQVMERSTEDGTLDEGLSAFRKAECLMNDGALFTGQNGRRSTQHSTQEGTVGTGLNARQKDLQ